MKASFVIPTYNCVVWLPHAVTSCLEQTHKDIEVIIVDDGSTDGTREYLNWISKDERVKVLRHAINEGRSAARNWGNREAQGDIICVLDADDISTPNRAELVVRKFSRSHPDYVYGGATVIDCLGRPSNVIGADVFSLDRSGKPPYLNYIVHSTASYTRAFADKHPYLMEMSKLGLDDWAQQICGLMSGAKFDFCNQRLCCYRVLDSQITQNRDNDAVAQAKQLFMESIKVKA